MEFEEVISRIHGIVATFHKRRDETLSHIVELSKLVERSIKEEADPLPDHEIRALVSAFQCILCVYLPTVPEPEDFKMSLANDGWLISDSPAPLEAIHNTRSVYRVENGAFEREVEGFGVERSLKRLELCLQHNGPWAENLGAGGAAFNSEIYVYPGLDDVAIQMNWGPLYSVFSTFDVAFFASERFVTVARRIFQCQFIRDVFTLPDAWQTGKYKCVRDGERISAILETHGRDAVDPIFEANMPKQIPANFESREHLFYPVFVEARQRMRYL